MNAFWFDIDDTLYSRRSLLLQAAKEVAPQGISLQEERFMRIFLEKSDENFPDVESGRITAWKSNVWRLEETFHEMGIAFPEGTGAAFADRYTYLQEHINLSPVMAKMMDYLADLRQEGPAEIFLGILTNGPSEHQWQKYDMLGLERWIQRKNVIVSGDLEFAKPDIQIFRAAEQTVNRLPGGGTDRTGWMVGDSLSHDIIGAKRAGWNTIWFNRGTSDDAGREFSDRIAHSETEMYEAIRLTFGK